LENRVSWATAFHWPTFWYLVEECSSSNPKSAAIMKHRNVGLKKHAQPTKLYCIAIIGDLVSCGLGNSASSRL